MAWFNIISGGCICVGTEKSYASPGARKSDKTDFHDLREDLDIRNAALRKVEESAKADKLKYSIAVADCDEGCWLVISVGRNLLPHAYIEKGEICTLQSGLSDEEKLRISSYLDEIEQIMQGLGYGTERQEGVIFNHFD